MVNFVKINAKTLAINRLWKRPNFGLSGLNLRPTEIGNEIGRDKSVISRFLKDPENYGRIKRPGRARTLDPRAERRLLKVAKNGDQSANQLRVSQQIPLSTRRIKEILSSSPDLNYEKRKSRPKLTNIHKMFRVQWPPKKSFGVKNGGKNFQRWKKI